MEDDIKTAQQRAREIVELLTRLTKSGKTLAEGAEAIEAILCDTRVEVWERAAWLAENATVIGDEDGDAQFALNGAAEAFRVEAGRARDGGPVGCRERRGKKNLAVSRLS